MGKERVKEDCFKIPYVLSPEDADLDAFAKAKACSGLAFAA
jgi:hypothetical protein